MVDCLRSARDVVELLLAQLDRPGLVVGCVVDNAVLRAHDGLECCAGCGALTVILVEEGRAGLDGPP